MYFLQKTRTLITLHAFVQPTILVSEYFLCTNGIYHLLLKQKKGLVNIVMEKASKIKRITTYFFLKRKYSLVFHNSISETKCWYKTVIIERFQCFAKNTNNLKKSERKCFSSLLIFHMTCKLK